jgi:tRNA nucleotidyltransferase (CCA-adding enzyme)
VARPGAAYPQVESGVASLMDRRVTTCPPGRRVAAAVSAARLSGARVLILGPRRVGEAAWHRLPAVPASAPEISARRLLMAGASLILVRQRKRVIGVIDAESATVARPALSLVHRLAREGPGQGRARLLRLAGELGRASGARVFVVGGFVRDVLLGRPGPDVDLLVEGDGVAFARRLAEELGGRLVVHPEFATASIEGAVDSDGRAIARIDVASARRERYEQPGALPVVSAAPAEEDLRRRDFSVNALALDVSPDAFGRLLDPMGGQADLRLRRLRPLHPLSFVEDPTRVFRAARYASRLGFRLDSAARRALALAIEIRDYPALSGSRLRAELELLAAEPAAQRGFVLLLRWNALSIWDHEYLVTSGSFERIRSAGRFCKWAKRTSVAIDPGEVALIALLADQRARVASRCLTRLGISGEPATELHAAATATALARRLGGTARQRASEIAEALRPVAFRVLVGAWLHGSQRARQRIQWFLSRGRAVRPVLSGAEVIALGVPRGPEVGACLDALRRLRLDGRVRTERQERAFVAAWGGRAANRPGQVARTARGARPEREA